MGDSNERTMTYLYFNSKGRREGSISNYTTLTDFPSIVFSRGTTNTARLVEVNIPLSHYVVSPPHNNIAFREGKEDGIRMAVLPEGNYTPDQMRKTIADQLTKAGNQQYTVSILLPTHCYEIRAENEFQLLWEDRQNVTLWDRLGYPAVNSGPGTVHGATRPPDLSPAGTYFLDISGLVACQKSGNFGSNGKFPLMLRGESNTVADWQNNVLSAIPVIPPSNYRFTIRLYDGEGRIVPLRRDWSFTLEIITSY